jgi:hypothetical protein
MKYKITLLILISTIVAVRADLVMQEQVSFGNQTNILTMTIKIHGDKIRQDTVGGESGDMSMIKDGKTGDSFILMHPQKTFTKNMKRKDARDNDAALSQPSDTGKSEKIGGYAAEIYNWSAPKRFWVGTNGMTEVLWIAKDFPNYEKIKPYFAQFEKADVSILGNGMQPTMNSLPGILVKSKMTVTMTQLVQTITTTLVSIKEEPVDPAIFEVPSDYTIWKPPTLPNHTSP